MKVLLVCQHYFPEPFNTSDVCEGLCKLGHEVTVLTAQPNTGMPNNEIPNKYVSSVPYEENINGVRVIRVPLYPRKNGAKNRIKNYLSFWRNSKRYAATMTEEFDVVVGYQFSPVMQVDAGIVYAKKHNVGMLLYCFDLWPASLTAGGFSEDSIPFKLMKKVSKRIYEQADRIAVTSSKFDEYFKNDLGIQREPSLYLPQYADDLFFSKKSFPLPPKYEDSKINLTFAGNIGRAQSVSTIIKAAAYVKEDSNILFHIVGSGSCLEDCKKQADRLCLSNIVFHGRKPIEEMPRYYAASDAMLVTFEDSIIASYTLPRKVTTYMAAGKPILASLSGETDRVITEAKCGICCKTEDHIGLARIIKEFVECKDKAVLGLNGRTYYEAHFVKKCFFKKLEEELNNLKGTKHHG